MDRYLSYILRGSEEKGDREKTEISSLNLILNLKIDLLMLVIRFVWIISYIIEERYKTSSQQPVSFCVHVYFSGYLNMNFKDYVSFSISYFVSEIRRTNGITKILDFIMWWASMTYVLYDPFASGLKSDIALWSLL